MKAALLEKIDALPNQPGVYLMKDHAGRIIYVGKAVNLRNRVRSYFAQGSSDTRPFVALLDRVLGDLETIVVASEKEALLLENELIKQHRPRFNVQLRDDKEFLCLRLDATHRFPRLETVRRPTKDGARYFGPYASAHSIREALRVVNRFFQLRTCSDHVLESRRRPCLLHQIGRCPAPCALEVDEATYRRNVDAVTLFLQGRGDAVVVELRGRMKAAAAALQFEEAARLRDQIIALERSLEKQAVATTEAVDQDVLGLYREGDRLCLYLLIVRGGRIAGGQAHHVTSEFPDEELIASFANQYYADDAVVPPEVLLPPTSMDLDAFAEVLAERRGGRVSVQVPQRGEKTELVRLAGRNAERAHAERKRTRDEVEAVLFRLKERLHLARLPRRMECFDISHHQGTGLVASKVASTDVELDRARYRHYALRTVGGNDDFASMKEILERRLTRGLAEGDLPDLIVIDGGKGQLASAHAAMRELGVEGVDLVSLAKSRDQGDDAKGAALRSPERIFLVGRKEPIVLPQTSPELFALTRLRDEAHRFAITYQRKVSRRRGLASVLDEVPGLGPARRAALLRHFGSVQRLREAGVEALAEVEGVGPAVAERVHAFLHASGEGAQDEVRDASLEDAAASPPGPVDSH